MPEVRNKEGNWIHVKDCIIDEDGFLARFTFDDNGVEKEVIVKRNKKDKMYYLKLLATVAGGTGLSGVIFAPFFIPGAVIGLIYFLNTQGEGYYNIKTHKVENMFPGLIHTENDKVYKPR